MCGRSLTKELQALRVVVAQMQAQQPANSSSALTDPLSGESPSLNAASVQLQHKLEQHAEGPSPDSGGIYTMEASQLVSGPRSIAPIGTHSVARQGVESKQEVFKHALPSGLPQPPTGSKHASETQKGNDETTGIVIVSKIPIPPQRGLNSRYKPNPETCGVPKKVSDTLETQELAESQQLRMKGSRNPSVAVMLGLPPKSYQHLSAVDTRPPSKIPDPEQVLAARRYTSAPTVRVQHEEESLGSSDEYTVAAEGGWGVKGSRLVRRAMSSFTISAARGVSKPGGASQGTMLVGRGRASTENMKGISLAAAGTTEHRQDKQNSRPGTPKPTWHETPLSSSQ